MSHFSPDPSIETPATMLHMAMDAAVSHGCMPDFTPDSLLETFNLHTDQPDGYGLAERLTNYDLSSRAFRSVTYFKYAAGDLITAANAYEANPAQEAIAQSLGSVVSRQLSRENHLCPVAKQMALSVTRDDIVPAHVRDMLQPRRSFEGFSRGAFDEPASSDRLRALLEDLLGPDLADRFTDLPMSSIVIVQGSFGPPPSELFDDAPWDFPTPPPDFSEFVEPTPTDPIPAQQKPPSWLRRWLPPFKPEA